MCLKRPAQQSNKKQKGEHARNNKVHQEGITAPAVYRDTHVGTGMTMCGGRVHVGHAGNQGPWPLPNGGCIAATQHRKWP